MGDAGIALEQGVAIEQQARAATAPEAPQQEAVPPPSRQVNLDDFYQEALVRYRIEQNLPGKKAWEDIALAAASKDNSRYQPKEQQRKPRSIVDKVHRQTLLLQARLEGVKDLGRFQELADYFESTVTESQYKFVKVPKGLSEEQKRKITEDWKAKGWNAGVYDIDEHEDGKQAKLTLNRRVPLRLERDQIKLLKGLIGTNNNPVELAEELQKIGFWFDKYRLKSPEEMGKLGQLFTAPHAKEALQLTQGVSRWSSDWFTVESSGKPVRVGQIEFLTQLAQSSDPKAVFLPELVQKVDILSRALNMRVGVTEIGQLQTIMNNPDYLDFAAYLTKLGLFRYREGAPIFEHITALDKAGVLKPLVDLYRSGVYLDPAVNGRSQLKELFDSYESTSELQKLQQEVIANLQMILAHFEVQTFLDDSPKREFAGLLGELRGYPINLDEAVKLDELFGKDLSKGKEAIYIFNLLQKGIKDTNRYDMDLNTLASIVSNPSILEVFTDKEFPQFMEALESKTGYKISKYDLYFNGSSTLVDVFKNPVTRQGLVQDSTVEVIRVIGSFNLDNSEYYIRLGNNPNMVPTLKALKDLGYDISDFRFSSEERLLGSIASDPEALTKLQSPEFKTLIARLKQEFKYEARVSYINELFGLYGDKELQQRLFTPENAEFIKKIRPNPISFLFELPPMLDLSPAYRDLVTQMAERFDFYPDFSSWSIKGQQEMLDKLLQNGELRTKLFSEQAQNIYKKLKEGFGYYRLKVEDVEAIANAPSDLPDFIAELRNKYKYSFTSSRRDLTALVHLAANRERLNSILDTLVKHGYNFRGEDMTGISQLIQYTEKLPTILSAVNQAMQNGRANLESEQAKGQYVFNAQDIPSLLQLEPFLNQLPTTVAMLNEVMGYQFNVRDSQQLVFVMKNGFTKERFVALKQIYDKYKNQYQAEFSFYAIQDTVFTESNEDAIVRLETYGYKFNFLHIKSLQSILESPDKEIIFQVLDALNSNLSLSYNPNLSPYYVKLAQIPGIKDKIKEAGTLVAKDDLMSENHFKLFVTLHADGPLYNHARKLLSDDYFNNIRDAQNRIQQFNLSMFNGEIPDDALAKIFALSGKATELDRIALKYGINAEIAKAAGNTQWQAPLLRTTSFQEANGVLTKMMADLAIHVIYPGLSAEVLGKKQNELVALAGKDKEFDDVLEICCRSVGIYGAKYPDKGQEFNVLMGAVRQSLELNLERNPKAYSQKRAELSTHQFDRIFEGLPQVTRDRVTQTWLNLAPRRRLRVNGEIVTAEEATLNRLNRIRDIVHTDLSVHLQELFSTKIRELEGAVKNGGANGSSSEQLAIYKQYLMTPEGQLRQDIPNVYRSIETFVRNGQAALKNPETPKEEKARLGKNLGTYQAIADSLKALYRLGTISEERYKARRDYLNEIDKHIGEFSGALKRLRILDPERRSADVNTRAFEEEVLLDLGKLKGTMAEENITGQTLFETESTVDFRNLARAPEITQSCQRLTEVTGFNQAAYSRLIDGSNEMIDVYEMRNGERNRLARSFVELSKVRLAGEGQPRLAVLIDREYVNPQYQNFGDQFSTEMMLHMLDRIEGVQELSLIFDSSRFTANPEVQKELQTRGYQLRPVSGEYFINESNVKLGKYYDSLGGISYVAQPSYKPFTDFYIIEKAA